MGQGRSFVVNDELVTYLHLPLAGAGSVRTRRKGWQIEMVHAIAPRISDPEYGIRPVQHGGSCSWPGYRRERLTATCPSLTKAKAGSMAAPA